MAEAPGLPAGTGVRLVPMTADRFRSWSTASRRGFAAQQVASGATPPREAEEYADREFGLLLPAGPATPDHHLWSVYAGDEEIGHVWLRVSAAEHGPEAFLFDIALLPSARGRGLGRATMLAVESAARGLRASRMRLNVFAHNTVARGLYDSLGYLPETTYVVLRPDDTDPAPKHCALPHVVLAPMTWAGFDTYVTGASEDKVALLPDGLATLDHFFWTATDAGREVGTLWLRIAPKSDGPHAEVLDCSVAESHYAGPLLVGAGEICRERGVVALEARVAGTDPDGWSVHQALGFTVVAQVLEKVLRAR